MLADTPDPRGCRRVDRVGDLLQRRPVLPCGLPVVVERAVREELLFRLGDAARGFVPADPALDSTVLGAMISTEHLRRRPAPRRGCGQGWRAGHRRRHGSRAGRRRRLHGPDPDRGRTRPTWPVVQEEVFGPVLVIQEADDVDHALRLANDTPLRARGRGLDLRRPDGRPSGAAFARGHRMDQHVRRLVARDSVRRFQAVGPRPRPFAARARRLHAAEDDLDLARMTRVAFVGLGRHGLGTCAATSSPAGMTSRATTSTAPLCAGGARGVRVAPSRCPIASRRRRC